MLDQKDIDLISSILKKELEPIKKDIEVLKIKQEMTHKKLDDVILNTKISERAIRKDISEIKDAQETIITILEGKSMLPKMN